MSEPASPTGASLIARGDDFGFCHAANVAIERAFQEGILTSASLMVSTPWFEEAADICRRHPEFQVGVHTTFTSEWHLYRWGPVLPARDVPTLVAPDGRFHARTAQFAAGRPDLGEFEAEMRAQVERALDYGVDVAYLDYHMRAARATPELEAILLRVAADCRVPVSRFVGDRDLTGLGGVPPAELPAAGARLLGAIEDGLWLLVTHPGLDVPEMQAIRPRWDPDGPSIAAARAAETAMLTSPEVKEAIRARGIRLVGYRKIRDALRAAGAL